MKLLTLTTLAAAGLLTACGGTVANNTGNNANLRGTNTNTGYVTNTNAEVKPTVPVNAVNITPGNITNGNKNSNVKSNSNTNSNHK